MSPSAIIFIKIGACNFYIKNLEFNLNYFLYHCYTISILVFQVIFDFLFVPHPHIILFAIHILCLKQNSSKIINFVVKILYLGAIFYLPSLIMHCISNLHKKICYYVEFINHYFLPCFLICREFIIYVRSCREINEIIQTVEI